MNNPITPLAALLVLASIAPAAAQTAWPARTVTIVVPYTPGGATDAIARLLADELRRPLGQSVIVENRSGAGGTIGAGYVARAQPDGYTLAFGAMATHAIAVGVYPKLAYDPVKDFVAVARLTVSPFVLAIAGTHPATNFDTFVAWARANAGKVNFSSTGIGGASHLAGELLAASAGFKATHIPYKGTPEAFGAVLGGESTYIIGNLQPMVPHVRSGRVKGLAVTGGKRFGPLPDIPTVEEVGHPAASVAPWFGIFAPAKTPDAVVQRLSDEIRAVIAKPEVQARMQATGDDPAYLPSAEFAALVQSEVPRWVKIVRDAGVKSE